VPLGLRVPATRLRAAGLRTPPASSGRRVPDDEDLEDYLGELEAEIAAVRRDLEARRSQLSDT
jgi:hypothetical protein